MICRKLTIVLLLLAAACQKESLLSTPLGAGFRYSSYGPWYDPGPEYWVSVGQQMAVNFSPEAVPQAIWIVGTQGGKGTVLNFPFTEYDPLIFPSSLGVPVTDEVSARWVSAVHQHGQQYQIFLKHWLPEYMQPTERDGLVFVDDSQGFESLEQLVAEFSNWGATFAPAPVAFQFGYPSDRKWWEEFENPPQTIGEAILTAVPNTVGLYWVDFTVLDVFPPE